MKHETGMSSFFYIIDQFYMLHYNKNINLCQLYYSTNNNISANTKIYNNINRNDNIFQPLNDVYNNQSV